MIGWDSEGADIDGEHRTIVIANSEDVVLADAGGINTERALDFITLNWRKDVHVSFGFSYDVNMLLGNLARAQIQRLWESGNVRFGRFRVGYIPRKSFTVQSEQCGGTIWDIFGFCQSSFVAALKSYGIPADIERIERMKRQRATFRPEDMDAIVRYCVEECKALARLGEKIARYFEDADLRLTRFDGAGAAAAALLRRENVADHMDSLPEPVEWAARHAYFGGRIECPRYGHTTEPIYGYDIRSAYPAAALDLPSLVGGTWRRTGGLSNLNGDTFGVFRVRFDMPRQRLYPFPWRARHGAIYFPPRGEGWYWTPEVLAALFNLNSGLEILDGYVFEPATDFKPFAFLADVYEQRRQWKADGIGAEKALKLAINSVYGKLAQQTGTARFHQLAFAGWITSQTRARLYLAAMQAPEETIMLATDAIYATTSLDLVLSERLGDWEESIHDGGTFVQSGVYWLGDKAAKTRGYDAASLDRDAILDAWRVRRDYWTARHRHFVGMGRALQAADWSIWRTWRNDPREVRLDPALTKRQDVPGLTPRPLSGLVPTWATEPLPGLQILSMPIVRPWDSDSRADIRDYWHKDIATEDLQWQI